MTPQAERVAAQLNVPVEAVIGQWGLETGWGKSVIPGTNNLGNIKDFSGNGTTAKDNMTGSVDKYRSYKDADEFAGDFIKVLTNRRYAGALNAKDALSYFSGLKAGGYAEDPNYIQSGAKAAQMAARVLAEAKAQKPTAAYPAQEPIKKEFKFDTTKRRWEQGDLAEYFPDSPEYDLKR